MKHRVDVIYSNRLWAYFPKLWKCVTFSFQNNSVKFEPPSRAQRATEAELKGFGGVAKQSILGKLTQMQRASQECRQKRVGRIKRKIKVIYETDKSWNTGEGPWIDQVLTQSGKEDLKLIEQIIFGTGMC